MRWNTIEELRCKNCGKLIGEAEAEGLIRKKCPNCKKFNLFFRRLGGKVHSFLEETE